MGRLAGIEEVDETYVGGKDPGSFTHNSLGSKALVGVAAEEDGDGIGDFVWNAFPMPLHRVSKCSFWRPLSPEAGSKRTAGPAIPD